MAGLSITDLKAKLERLKRKVCTFEERLEHLERKPRRVDPFKTEKASYNRRLLEVTNPFLEIRGVQGLMCMPSDNVSDGRFMDEAALASAARILLKPAATASKQFKTMRSELGIVPVHSNFLLNMKLLTSPRRSESNAALAGSRVFADGSNLEGKVHDMRLNSPDNLVTVIVIECDRQGAAAKLDQASVCAVQAAKANMRKGCFQPIYVHHWSEHSWRYGVLRPKGIVTVKDGSVTEVSCQEGVITSKDEALVQELESKLKVCTQRLREDYRCSYPDDDYVLGTLHLCHTEMGLIKSPNEFIGEGGVRFFNSLVRTFIGDRALALSSKDIEENRAKREGKLDEYIADSLSVIPANYKRLREGFSSYYS